MVAVNKEKKRRVVGAGSNKPGLVSLFSSVAPSPSKSSDKKDATLRKSSDDTNLKNKLPAKYIKPSYLEREKNDTDFKLTTGIPSISLISPETSFYKGKIKSHWEWQGFNPVTRKDNLVLHSWKRKTEEQDPNLKQIEHHVQLAIPTFSDEVYEQELKSNDWTLEETRHLFDLCEKFDLRFMVVHDRFISQDKPRSLEDLKERFYQVSNALSILQKRSSEKTEKPENLTTIPIINFDKAREKERKDHLEKLYARTPEQIDEEESLVIMIRRLRHNGRSYIRQREHLLQALNVPQPSSTQPVNSITSTKETKPPIIPASDPRPSTQPPIKRKKKVVKSAVTPAASAQDSVLPSLASAPKEKNKSPSIVNSPTLPPSQAPAVKSSIKETKKVAIPKPEEKPIVEAELPAPVTIKKEKMPVGVHLRSSRLVFPDSSQQEAFAEKLHELGADHRPFMPTESFCTQFEEIQRLFLELTEVNEQVEQLDKIKSHSLKLSRRPSHLSQDLGPSGVDLERNHKRLGSTNSQSREKKKHRENFE